MPAGAGLELEIVSAEISSDGTAIARFALRDAQGAPLDRAGTFTPGAVSASFILGWLGEESGGVPGLYTSYTTRIQTSGSTSAEQASTDSGGTFSVVDALEGLYEYEFGTSIDVADPSKTHTIGAIATRTVDGVRYVSNTTFSWVPDGSEDVLHREVVTTDTCNNCHGRLEFHGGARREVAVCVMCHNPQTVDPDTNQNLDFGTMVHKIHSGKDLPSVVAGTPYQIIGFGNRVHDYSTVAYPQPVQHCESCHSGGEHSDQWKLNPTQRACGSCHDTTSFVSPPPDGMVLHGGGEFEDDSLCTVCHRDSGGLLPISENHFTNLNDPTRPQFELAIVSVQATGPGQTPEVVFSAQLDGVRHDILANPLNTLAIIFAGPTTDFANNTRYVIQGNNAVGTLTAEGTDYFRYTFPAAMPVDATGTYAFGMEGRYVAGSLRIEAFNPIAYGAVTDPEPAPRRQVITAEQCNTCHYDLRAHGGIRRNAEYCNFCHTADLTNAGRVARFEDTTVEAQSVHLKPMIHKIHMGRALTQGYVLGGNPAPTETNPGGNPKDFGDVRYPRDQRDCAACHVGNSSALPLTTAALPSRSEVLECIEDPGDDENDYCDERVSESFFLPPTSSACVSCHDAPWTVAHAELNTTGAGAESCTTCHGAGAAFDAALGHWLAP